MSKKYRKKPIVIQAFKIGVDPVPEWAEKAGHFKIVSNDTAQPHAEVVTLEGTMKGYLGDYIIQGARGELYPCRADIFDETYLSIEQNEDNVYRDILSKIYSAMHTGNDEKLQAILNSIYAWGIAKSDPEASLCEILKNSQIALSKIQEL